MHSRPGRLGVALWLLLVLLCQTGCRDTALLARPDWWPFGGDPNYEFLNERGYVAPSQRVRQLQKLAREASKKTPEEQQQISQQLAEQIRGELDPLVRQEIVRTLAHYDTPTANTVLAAALEDPDPLVRVEACRAWGHRGGAEASRHLVEVFNTDTDKDVRLAALRQLGEVGDIYAVSAVAEALEDPDPALQYSAVNTLRKLTNEDFGNDVNAWRAFVRGENPPPHTPSLVERFQRLLF